MSDPNCLLLGRKLTPGEVALLETFVVPRYLLGFGELLLGLMLTGEAAKVAHLGCRTGYPDHQLIESIPACTVIGVDPSLAAVELAKNKAALASEPALQYRVGLRYPLNLDPGSFSHTLSLHPMGSSEARVALFNEMNRLLYSGGQALVALPLRGSFQEVGDLLREYALKHDDAALGKSADDAMLQHPTVEMLADELEAAGLVDVDVEVEQRTLLFEDGRTFVDDPVTRLLIIPELQALMGVADLKRPLEYVSDAIDKYWAHRQLEVQVNIGAASARKV